MNVRCMPTLLLAACLVALATTAFAGDSPADEALSGAPSAAADASDPPALRAPLPFDHPLHQQAFGKVDLSCTDCHPVGAALEDDEPPADLPLPSALATCHACHLAEIEGAPRKAADTCATCHSERSELIPRSHDGGWERAHGPQAMARRSGCDSCHDTATCVGCHERRGATAGSPHPPGFGSFHGVEARMDPQRCSACHTGSSCTNCHLGGSLPW